MSTTSQQTPRLSHSDPPAGSVADPAGLLEEVLPHDHEEEEGDEEPWDYQFTPEDLEKAKLDAEHATGDATVMVNRVGGKAGYDVLFRRATPADYDAWKADSDTTSLTEKSPQKKRHATKALATRCLLWPKDKSRRNKIFERFPGGLDAIGNEILKEAGLLLEEDAKKL